MPDTQLENDIREVMRQVPTPIRQYFASGKVGQIARGLFTAYGLHVDQGAVVEREIILLLLGLKTPQEFMDALANEGELDEKTITSIVADINNQIFIPLRAQMEKGTPPSTAPAYMPPPPPPMPVFQPRPTPPPTPAGVGATTVNVGAAQPQATGGFVVHTADAPVWGSKKLDVLPKGFYAPPPQSPRYPGQDDLSSYLREVPQKSFEPKPITKPAPPPAPSRVGAPPPAQPMPPQGRPPLREVHSAPPVLPETNSAYLLEDHEEPSPHVPEDGRSASRSFVANGSYPAIAPARPTPEAWGVLSSSVPPTGRAPTLPGTFPPVPAPPSSNPFRPTLGHQEPLHQSTPVTYSTDPYRESLEL